MPNSENTEISYGGSRTDLNTLRQDWLNFLSVIVHNCVPGWSVGIHKYAEALPIDEKVCTNRSDAVKYVQYVIARNLCTILFRDQTMIRFTLDNAIQSSSSNMDNKSCEEVLRFDNAQYRSFKPNGKSDEDEVDYLIEYLKRSDAKKGIAAERQPEDSFLVLPSITGNLYLL